MINVLELILCKYTFEVSKTVKLMNQRYKRMMISLLMISFCIVSISYCNELKKDDGEALLASKELTSPENTSIASVQ